MSAVPALFAHCVRFPSGFPGSLLTTQLATSLPNVRALKSSGTGGRPLVYDDVHFAKGETEAGQVCYSIFERVYKPLENGQFLQLHPAQSF
ncbi:hypothetical protein BDZ89DRAFT_1062203 [Hymenopellis radicata]|nr:hypothetical protein BDZ89DRAFT_1062203 [Hymenopellis radicata]